ncbi:Uncharacterized protein BP5553_08196 [Venustampulla echinocandica]|uniref:Oxidation resistance protein 1 n=1 Tax=Venustampulla echinocandica TaxID=2656787 RepID=A0A370TG02_9HELO|nr:Uncharacterized protein BP5553_08196 [Venustampulla echinocandica]RDL33828.1 Uncharacterized protein BP5553_08196 [Venustampulla echinocandica]
MNPRHDQTPTSSPSSGASTPAGGSSLSSSWILPATVSHAVGGLMRRFSSEPHKINATEQQYSSNFSASKANGNGNEGIDGVYTPPYRNASPFQPPPLYPISLSGYKESTLESARLLSKELAEEIRLLVPPRLQLCEEWKLVYSLEEDGVSLGTLYSKCDKLSGLRNGFVLVVKDADGGLFGAYLTERPHPSPHYFGTGECFLWRASFLSPASFSSALTPPQSDATSLQSSSTIASSSSASIPPVSNTPNSLFPPPPSPLLPTGASTPERIRFKAFPYSGVNDYLIFCETGFLSIGGGDGRYGLWLDDNFEKGISSSCPTFGNEPLSEEGEKFEIVGVELWSIGN